MELVLENGCVTDSGLVVPKFYLKEVIYTRIKIIWLYNVGYDSFEANVKLSLHYDDLMNICL